MNEYKPYKEEFMEQRDIQDKGLRLELRQTRDYQFTQTQIIQVAEYSNGYWEANHNERVCLEYGCSHIAQKPACD